MPSQKIFKIFVLTVLLQFYPQLVEGGVTKDKNIVGNHPQHHEASPIQPHVAPPTNIVASPIQPHDVPQPKNPPHSGLIISIIKIKTSRYPKYLINLCLNIFF